MSAKNGGGVQTPSPLLSQKSEIGLLPLPPLSEKIRNRPTPPLALSEIIFCHTPMEALHDMGLTKSPFKKRAIFNFQKQQASGHHMLPVLHVFWHLAPPCQKKSDPPSPLVRKNSEIGKPPSSLSEKIWNLLMWTASIWIYILIKDLHKFF